MACTSRPIHEMNMDENSHVQAIKMLVEDTISLRTGALPPEGLITGRAGQTAQGGSRDASPERGVYTSSASISKPEAK